MTRASSIGILITGLAGAVGVAAYKYFESQRKEEEENEFSSYVSSFVEDAINKAVKELDASTAPSVCSEGATDCASDCSVMVDDLISDILSEVVSESERDMEFKENAAMAAHDRHTNSDIEDELMSGILSNVISKINQENEIAAMKMEDPLLELQQQNAEIVLMEAEDVLSSSSIAPLDLSYQFVQSKSTSSPLKHQKSDESEYFDTVAEMTPELTRTRSKSEAARFDMEPEMEGSPNHETVPQKTTKGRRSNRRRRGRNGKVKA